MTWPGLTPSQAALREALSFSFRLREGPFADRTVHALLRILPQLNWDRLCPVRLVFVELGFQYWAWPPDRLHRRGTMPLREKLASHKRVSNDTPKTKRDSRRQACRERKRSSLRPQ